MANTLGLDDDLDRVEVVQVDESAFNTKIANEEAEAIVTVGEMFDLLRGKIVGSATARKCASASVQFSQRRPRSIPAGSHAAHAQARRRRKPS